MSLIAMYDLQTIERPATVEGDGKPQPASSGVQQDRRTMVTA
jgi:hypothetical protein